MKRNKAVWQKWWAASRDHRNKLRRERYTPERRQDVNLRRMYGITRQQKLKMAADQDGRCAICARAFDVLHVDHDHQTGEVRRLLCRYCNAMLGFSGDSPETLIRGAEYLQSFLKRTV